MADWQTTKLSPDHCPWCGALVTAASAPDGAPSPGDLTICLECVSVCKFDADLRLERCPDTDWQAETDIVDTVRRYRAAAMQVDRRKPTGGSCVS